MSKIIQITVDGNDVTVSPTSCRVKRKNEGGVDVRWRSDRYFQLVFGSVNGTPFDDKVIDGAPNQDTPARWVRDDAVKTRYPYRVKLAKSQSDLAGGVNVLSIPGCPEIIVEGP